MTTYTAEAAPSEATKAFLDLFKSTGESGGLLEGLTLLWATEYVYLNAWKYAGEAAGGVESPAGDESQRIATKAVREKFIPNWSSKEFETFVERLAGLLDEFAEGRDDTDKCAKVWKETLDAELGFWPDVGDF